MRRTEQASCESKQLWLSLMVTGKLRFPILGISIVDNCFSWEFAKVYVGGSVFWVVVLAMTYLTNS